MNQMYTFSNLNEDQGNVTNHNPWGTSLLMMEIGLVLTYFSVSIGILPVFLTTNFIGAILLLIGAYRVKKMNAELNHAYKIILWFFGVTCLVELTLAVHISNSAVISVLSFVSILLKASLLVFFFRSIKYGILLEHSNELDEEEVEDKFYKICKSITILGVILVFSIIQEFLPFLSLLLFVAILGILIHCMVQFRDLRSILQQVFIKEKPVQNPKRKLVCIILIGILFTKGMQPVISYCSLTYKVTPDVSDIVQGTEDKIIADLRTAGFPEEVISILPQEELENYKDIDHVKIIKSECDSDNEEDGKSKFQDLNNLENTYIYSYYKKDSNYSGRVRVLIYGKWKEKPKHCFTDTIFIDPDREQIGFQTAYGVYADQNGKDQIYPLSTQVEDEMNLVNNLPLGMLEYSIPANKDNYRFMITREYSLSMEKNEKTGVEEEGTPIIGLKYNHRVNYPFSLKHLLFNIAPDWSKEKEYESYRFS